MSDPEIHGLEELKQQHRALQEAVRKDPRYHVEAYLLVCQAVGYTCHKLGERRHITGAELVNGLCDLAVERFGYLAPTVLQHWGVSRTGDVGEIVFNLIDVELLSRRPEDSKEDFEDLFDLPASLRERYRIDADALADEEDE
jgi:uncharacterized repeat protein (TIGR04138 family)